MSGSTAITRLQRQVVIGIDPHKGSWTAAAVSESMQALDSIRVSVSPEGYRMLRRFAQGWNADVWAIEGARGMGAPLVSRLQEDGIHAVDIPPKLAARVRILSTGHGRKTDEADAVSVGIAAFSARRLNSAAVDGALTALRAVVDHREDLIKTRIQTINRLHVVLSNLIPGGVSTVLTAAGAAELLRRTRPRGTAGKALRALAVDLTDEIRQLDRRIAKAAVDVDHMLTASGSTLVDLHGLGNLTAAKILSRVGNVTRFRSAAAFATYTGTAPLEASSGEMVRHRLSRAGDRQLNSCLHIMALAQIRSHPDGKAYYLRKRAEGKSKREALRCLKRRLSDVVYRQMIRDHQRLQADPGGHSGAALSSRAAG